jgi:hypothetical protein
VGSHDTTEASSKRLPRADDAYSQSAPVHASDADAPTSRSARRARGRPGKMNGGLCQLPGYLFTASHKGQAPPNHDATANSPLLLWVWGCRCDVPRCAPLARLALYSPCPCPCRAADCGVALGWQHAPAHGDTGHGAARGASAEREREQATAVRRAGHGAAPCFAPSPVRSRHTQVRYGTGWNTGARGSWDGFIFLLPAVVFLSLSHARAFWTGGRTAALLVQAPRPAGAAPILLAPSLSLSLVLCSS